MTTESGTPKRRGRPPAPEDKRRRNNLTFRIRSDLKQEIERKATNSGRSISEEMEFIIEKALPLFDENANSFISDIRPLLGIHIRDKFNSVSSEIYQASIGQRSLVGKDESGMTSEDILALHERTKEGSENAVVLYDKNLIDANFSVQSVSKGPTSEPTKLPLSWSQDPAEREGALHMARAFLHAARKGSVEALDEMLGSEIVATALAEVVLAEAARLNLSTGLDTDQPKPAGQVASLIIKGFRDIAGEAKRPGEKQPSLSENAPEGDHSLSALVAMIGRLTARSPDLTVLWTSSWPHRFADLPADTRAALIGKLQGQASALYEDMMRPVSGSSPGEPSIRPSPRDISRGVQVGALRRMQNALLPRDENEDEGLDDRDEEPSKGRA